MMNMNGVWVVARKDMRDLLSGKFYLYVILMCLICLPYFDGARNVLNGLSKQGASPEELRLAAQSFLNTLAFTLPISLTMLICSVFAAYSILMDKTKRTLESLVATPLSLRQIWVGKSLAVALPGLAVGLLISLLTILAVDLAFVRPATGSLVVPGAFPMVSALIITPALVLLVVLMVSVLQMIMANPRIPSIIFSVIFIAIYMSAVVQAIPRWNFGLSYLAAAVVVGIVLLFLLRLLTKERTILSSKG